MLGPINNHIVKIIPLLLSDYCSLVTSIITFSSGNMQIELGNLELQGSYEVVGPRMSKSGEFVGPIEVMANIPRTRCTYTHHIVALDLLRITLMLRFDSKEKKHKEGDMYAWMHI